MKSIAAILYLALASVPAAAANDTEVRAQAIIGLLIQQRDEAMNQVAAIAVDLAKTKAELDTLKAEVKPPRHEER